MKPYEARTCNGINANGVLEEAHRLGLHERRLCARNNTDVAARLVQETCWHGRKLALIAARHPILLALAVLFMVLPSACGGTARPLPLPIDTSAHGTDVPPPPQLPANFSWTGRYIVSDLGVDVPFTWQGSNGYNQMTAGSWKDPIYFTNLIYDGFLYTLTYKWPGIPPNVLGKCSRVAKYTLADYNAFLNTSRYVGPAILGGRTGPQVNHFRASIVFELGKPLLPPRNVLPPVGGRPNVVAPTEGSTSNTTAAPGLPIRFPILSADFFVDGNDSHKFWQVLHFGLQNYYDPSMDEWINMQKFSDKPGKVVLPDDCKNATASPPLPVPSR